MPGPRPRLTGSGADDRVSGYRDCLLTLDIKLFLFLSYPVIEYPFCRAGSGGRTAMNGRKRAAVQTPSQSAANAPRLRMAPKRLSWIKVRECLACSLFGKFIACTLLTRNPFGSDRRNDRDCSPGLEIRGPPPGKPALSATMTA